MTVDLFAGISVSDYDRARSWYERFWGSEPAFLPNDVEAVWEVAGHRYVYIEVRPEHAGHAQCTLFVDDLDEWVDPIVGRGIEPVVRETYDNGVRHVIFRDPDGNEISFGAPPTEPARSETRATD
jgi:catechol 2,3-dioxygenase-like lactoylglutathione lyase family enzyme